MSLIRTIKSDEQVNWLASSTGMRLKTATAYQTMGIKDGDVITVKSGTIYPTDDANAEGIVFENVNVTNGDYPCSILTAGYVLADRLTVSDAAKTALEASGIKFESAPEFEREY